MEKVDFFCQNFAKTTETNFSVSEPRRASTDYGVYLGNLMYLQGFKIKILRI